MRSLVAKSAADCLVFSVFITRELKGSEGRVGRPFIIVVVFCKRFSGPVKVNAVKMSGLTLGMGCSCLLLNPVRN